MKICPKTLKPFEEAILSDSGNTYKRGLRETGLEDPYNVEFYCTCRGYLFTGHCKHVSEMVTGLKFNYYTDDKEIGDICPCCGCEFITLEGDDKLNNLLKNLKKKQK